MICPNCGAQVSDGAQRCPACHADLGSTMVIPKLDGSWCENCGALIPKGAATCPGCGFPVPKAPAHFVSRGKRKALGVSTVYVASEEPVVKAAGPEEDARPVELEADSDEQRPAHAAPGSQARPDDEPSPDDTHALVRIESAIPSEPVPGLPEHERDHGPRFWTFVVAHPWNPSASDPRAKTEADTSKAGYTGEMESLSGQDETKTQTGVIQDGDSVSLAKLQDVYGRLGDLNDRATQVEGTYRSTAASADEDARSKGKAEADQLSLDVSNLISSIDEIDVTSGTYATDAQNLKTLGNYLRNRTDALDKAWTQALELSDPVANASQIDGFLTGSDESSWQTQFEQAYPTMSPHEKSGN